MMTEISTPIKLKFNYNVCAVMFGADQSLLNIKLHDGFLFVEKSLAKNYLNLAFKTDSMELHLDYEDARIDDNTLDVICAVKEMTIEHSTSTAGDFFVEITDQDLVSLNNQIRAIRFMQECSLMFKKISFRMVSEEYMIEHTKSCAEFYLLFPVRKALASKTISRLHCDKALADQINIGLQLISFPLEDEILNACHRHFDLSYQQDKFISIRLLITALEMLYLEDEKSIKVKLANRCAVYLYTEKIERIQCHRKLLTLYVKRCKFVHEGIFNNIDNEDIIFLRHCVRNSLFGMRSDNKSKKERIED